MTTVIQGLTGNAVLNYSSNETISFGSNPSCDSLSISVSGNTTLTITGTSTLDCKLTINISCSRTTAPTVIFVGSHTYNDGVRIIQSNSQSGAILPATVSFGTNSTAISMDCYSDTVTTLLAMAGPRCNINYYRT